MISWIKHDKPARLEYMPKLMEHVRLPLLSRDYLVQVKRILFKHYLWPTGDGLIMAFSQSSDRLEYSKELFFLNLRLLSLIMWSKNLLWPTHNFDAHTSVSSISFIMLSLIWFLMICLFSFSNIQLIALFAVPRWLVPVGNRCSTKIFN